MPVLELFLFGRFRAQSGGRVVQGLDVHKVQELLCYLLVNRNRPHFREHLAGMLWNGDSDTRARGYLRKALWQLQASLANNVLPQDAHILEADAECIKLTPGEHCWLDLDVVEYAYDAVKSVPGKDLDVQQADSLENAVGFYEGDLLEGWGQHWCICERERYHYMYLAMMDKLLDHCEACRAYERGIDFDMRMLHLDPVHERTYQKLMRLHYLTGDRTSALREYEHCAEALSDELGVPPGQQTKALYRQILDDELDTGSAYPAEPHEKVPSLDVPRMLARLQELQTTISDLQGKVQREIGVLEDLIAGYRH